MHPRFSVSLSMDDLFPEGEPLAQQEGVENEETKTQAVVRDQLTPGLISFLMSDQFLCHLVGFVNEQQIDPDQPCTSRQPQPDPAHSIFVHEFSVGLPGAGAQQGSAGPVLHSDATKSGLAPMRTQTTSAQQAAAWAGALPISLKTQCASFFRSLQAAQQAWTQQAVPAAAINNNLSDISKPSPPADQRRATPRTNMDDSWKAPSFKDLLECAWKSPDSVNHRRYIALACIICQLDAFRLASLDLEASVATRRAYKILRGLHHEMDLIRIAESHDASWGIMREMENQPETNDPDLQKSLARAEGRLKRKQKESSGRAAKAPFCGHGRGSAALRNAQAPYLQLH